MLWHRVVNDQVGDWSILSDMHYSTRTEIEQLSPEDRLRLIEDVWETLESVPGSLKLSEEHREILDQRHAELERNPDATMSWDEMMQQLRNQFRLA